jgi:hypothetical protein
LETVKIMKFDKNVGQILKYSFQKIYQYSIFMELVMPFNNIRGILIDFEYEIFIYFSIINIII